MGCFLSCFGSSRRGNGRKQGKNRVRVHLQTRTSYTSQFVKLITSPQLDIPVEPHSDLVSESSGKHEEESSGGSHKKVRFDSNIIAYDPVLTEEEPEDTVEDQNVGKLDNQGNNLPKTFESSNSDSSFTTSADSYPPNHRYENCRDSDDEYDYWVDSGESDLEDEVGDSSDFCDDDDGDTDGNVTDDGEIDQTRYGPIPAGRKTSLSERSSGYIPPVLRPVENLAQWKAVKAKGTRDTSSNQRKENFASDLGNMISFSDEPALKEVSVRVKEKVKEPEEKSTREVQVHASLSAWMTSPETVSTSATSRAGLDDVFSGKTASAGSSLSRSPDEMPPIGTVGTYWSYRRPEHDTHSVSSFKGIQNTTN